MKYMAIGYVKGLIKILEDDSDNAESAWDNFLDKYNSGPAFILTKKEFDKAENRAKKITKKFTT